MVKFTSGVVNRYLADAVMSFSDPPSGWKDLVSPAAVSRARSAPQLLALFALAEESCLTQGHALFLRLPMFNA